jgi:Ser/Thr protein kinase RdoA (MazF antagonist)
VSVLQTLRDQTLPDIHGLRRQVIHNDANPSNVLLASDGQHVAFIDFGDMLLAPRAVEVATAAAYLRTLEPDVLAYIAPFVAAYHDASPLTRGEIDSLYALIQTRLCMTLVILYWRLSARDEDDAYRQKSVEDERDAAEFLVRLANFGSAAFSQRIGQELS